VKGLSSGIADVGRIPVIGIVNDRPNGPCYNTNVDVDAIRNKLESIINERSKKEGLLCMVSINII